MEDVGTVAVDADAMLVDVIGGISTYVATPVHDEDAPPELTRRAFSDDRTREASTDDQQVEPHETAESVR